MSLSAWSIRLFPCRSCQVRAVSWKRDWYAWTHHISRYLSEPRTLVEQTQRRFPSGFVRANPEGNLRCVLEQTRRQTCVVCQFRRESGCAGLKKTSSFTAKILIEGGRCRAVHKTVILPSSCYCYKATFPDSVRVVQVRPFWTLLDRYTRSSCLLNALDATS